MILPLLALCFICSAFECGISRYPNAGEIKKWTTPLIIGGKKAREHEFPWQVRLSRKKTDKNWYLCGGSIISARWVLTAAHCLTNVTTVKVIVGEYKKDVNNPNRQVIYSENIFIHPKFGSIVNLSYDVGLIKTKQAIKFNANVQPVCLPKTNDLYVNKKVVVSGWGLIRYPDGRDADYLKYVILNTMTNKDCKKFYRNITDDMMCAMDKRSSDKKGSFKGDSGGPVVLKGAKGVFSIIGVISWSYNSSQNKPSGFARVTSTLDWIKKISNVVSGTSGL